MSHPLQLTLMIVLFILSCSVQFFFSVIGYKVLHSLPLYQGLLAAPLQCSLLATRPTSQPPSQSPSWLAWLPACLFLAITVSGGSNRLPLLSHETVRAVSTGGPGVVWSARRGVMERARLLVVWGLGASLVVGQVGASWYSIQMWNKHQ